MLTAIFVFVDFSDVSDYAEGYSRIPEAIRDSMPLPSGTLLWILAIATLLGALAAICAGVMI